MRDGTTALVWMTVAIYTGIGLYCLISPVEALAPVEVTALGSGGVVELRAMYGGLQLGMAVFLSYCARSPERVRLGLLAGVCSIGGLGLARLAAWLVAQPEGLLLPFLCMVEVGGASLGAWQLWRTADQQDPSGSHLG